MAHIISPPTPNNDAPNNYFYKYDGTNISVVSTSIYPPSSSGIIVFNGALYFSTWKFDGTNFTALNGNPLPSHVGAMDVFSNAIYFNGRGQHLRKPTMEM